MGELWFGRVAVWERSGAVVVCGSCGVWELRWLPLVHRVFRVFSEKLFQKFTAAKFFASDHFAIAH